MQQEVQLFKDKLDALKLATNIDGRQFLSELMASKDKWSLAYDTGGWRWGFMTSNMVEMFNSLLKGCRGVPMTAIAPFTFYKLNAWFVSRKNIYNNNNHTFGSFNRLNHHTLHE